MNRLLITFITALLITGAVNGQNTAPLPLLPDSAATSAAQPQQPTAGTRNPIFDVFSHMPDTVMPLLSRNARLDMIDYYTYGLSNGVNNRLEEPCRIISSTENELTIQTGRISRIQIAMQAAGSDTLVSFIETVETPQPDSHITFRRTSDWKEVQQKNTISMTDFLTDRRADATEVPVMFFCSIVFDGETGMYIFTNTTGSRYEPSEAPAYMSKLLPEIKAAFDGRRWKVRH